MPFFSEIEKNPKIYSNHKRPQIDKAILKQISMLSDFKLYYKVIIIKIVLYWHKNRQIGQWNIMESSEYSQLITTKEARIYNGKLTVSSISSVGKTGQIHSKKLKLNHSHSIY